MQPGQAPETVVQEHTIIHQACPQLPKRSLSSPPPSLSNFVSRPQSFSFSIPFFFPPISHFSFVLLFATLWIVAHQAPLSMGFSRQEYWSGLPCPSPGDLPYPGIEPGSPPLQADSLPLSHQRSLTAVQLCFIFDNGRSHLRDPMPLALVSHFLCLQEGLWGPGRCSPHYTPGLINSHLLRGPQRARN